MRVTMVVRVTGGAQTLRFPEPLDGFAPPPCAGLPEDLWPPDGTRVRARYEISPTS
ncbi:hypothetical protein GCM10010344_79160 [Streptomyces bluensis]|nr:hypothetical protein GCM10010344_79160 [Streptomyces bluensis]